MHLDTIMNSKQVAEVAISVLNKRITNEVFMIIQNDKNLMYEYLRAVEIEGLDTVNQTIGKQVKDSYILVNINDREDNPSCRLVQSYQKFE